MSTKGSPRTYCHAGCRRAAQDAALRLEANTLKVSGDGCWLWQGATNANGYGILSVGHRTVFAHRLALELALGRPLGVDLALHKCNTRRCVRVGAAHLYPGDHADNMRDMADANTGAGSRTSWEDRLDMAERLAGGEAPAAVASDYGVTEATAWRWHRHFFPEGVTAAPDAPASMDAAVTRAPEHTQEVVVTLDEAAIIDPFSL